MKSLTELWKMAALDCGSLCSVSTTRDYKTVTSRVEHEGLSFMTITLPSFADSLQKALSAGKVDHDLFTGFSWRGGLPRFLGGFLDRVFDRGTGLLLDDPCAQSIFSMRQLTLMFGKIGLDCSDERKSLAVRKYIQCESDVKRSDALLSEDLRDSFARISMLLFGDVLAVADRKIYNGELVPKHGPGATADKLRGNAKFDQAEWTERLEGIFPYGDYALPSWRYYYRLDGVHIREPRNERPVKVTLVPKTLKTPRVIAVEPTCMQYMQQGVAEILVELLETDPTVSGMVGFSDQTPNQRLALRGSVKGDLATLDMAEASDRVSNQHVRLMMARFPHLNEAVQATRSRKADVRGHGVIRLAKFASMGSALCFPVEAMVFTALVFVGIEQAQGHQLTRRDFKSYASRVRVYGDDIIVPVDTLSAVTDTLEAFGLKVNDSKTFGRGKFRESCGRDYYNGTDVTPVRVRHVIPSSRRDVRETVGTVSLRNLCYTHGLWRTAGYLDEILGKLLNGAYPNIEATSPVLGRVSFLGYSPQRMDPHLHRPLVKGYVVRSRIPRSRVSGEGALLKWFLKRGDQPFADRDHLERQGRPEAVSMKLRWATPY